MRGKDDLDAALPFLSKAPEAPPAVAASIQILIREWWAYRRELWPSAQQPPPAPEAPASA